MSLTQRSVAAKMSSSEVVEFGSQDAHCIEEGLVAGMELLSVTTEGGEDGV